MTLSGSPVGSPGVSFEKERPLSLGLVEDRAGGDSESAARAVRGAEVTGVKVGVDGKDIVAVGVFTVPGEG